MEEYYCDNCGDAFGETNVEMICDFCGVQFCTNCWNGESASDGSWCGECEIEEEE